MDKLTKLFKEFDQQTKEVFDDIDEKITDMKIHFQGIKEALQTEVETHQKAVKVIKEFVSDLGSEGIEC